MTKLHMDTLFYEQIEGTPPSIELQSYAPYDAHWPNGERTVVFGTEVSAHDAAQNGGEELIPAGALMVGAVGGLAVAAEAGRANAATKLRYLAGNGWAGTALCGIAMRTSLHDLSHGRGPTAALSIATNLADATSPARLHGALIDTADLAGFFGKNTVNSWRDTANATSDNQLYYLSKADMLKESADALRRHLHTLHIYPTDSLDADLAHAYADLLHRAEQAGLSAASNTLRQAWGNGLLAACMRLEKGKRDLKTFLDASTYARYRDLQDAGLSGARADETRLAVNQLSLPEQTRGRKSSRTARSAKGGPTPEDGSETTPGADNPMALYRQQLAELARLRESFLDCVRQGRAIRNSVTNALVDHPSLSPESLRSEADAVRRYAAYITNPDTLAKSIATLAGAADLSPQQAAVIAAAASAYGFELPPNLQQAAAEHAAARLDLLHIYGINEVVSIPKETIASYMPIATLYQAPAYLVTLAAQVVTDNAHSMATLPSREPLRPPQLLDEFYSGSTSPADQRDPRNAGYNSRSKAIKQQEKKIAEDTRQYHKDVAAWEPAATQVDKIARALHAHLQRRYKCDIPDPANISSRLRHHRGGLTLKALALCAQAESTRLLAASEEVQQAFVHTYRHILDEPDPQIPLQATQARKTYQQLLRIRQQYRSTSPAPVSSGTSVVPDGLIRFARRLTAGR